MSAAWAAIVRERSVMYSFISDHHRPSSGSRRPCRVMFHHESAPSTDHVMVTVLTSSSDQRGGLTRIRSSVIPRPRPPGTYSAMYRSTNVRAHPGFVITRSTTKIFSSAIPETLGSAAPLDRTSSRFAGGFPDRNKQTHTVIVWVCFYRSFYCEVILTASRRPGRRSLGRCSPRPLVSSSTQLDPCRSRTRNAWSCLP